MVKKDMHRNRSSTQFFQYLDHPPGFGILSITYSTITAPLIGQTWQKYSKVPRSVKV